MMESPERNMNKEKSRSVLLPNRSRRSVQLLQSVGTCNKKAKKQLEKLLDRTWETYHSSDLHNIDLNKEADVKRCQRVIQLALADVGIFVVEYKVCNSFRFKNSDHPAIEVTVRNRSEQVVYNCFFISWGASEPLAFTDSGIHLPVLICRGKSSNFIHRVNLELENAHNCVINKFNFDRNDMLFVFVGMLSTKEFDDDDDVEFHFQIPNKRESGTAMVKLELRVISKVWACINKNDSVWTEEQAFCIWDEICWNIANIFGIQGKNLVLCAIVVPSCNLSETKVKSFSVEDVHLLLRFLMSYAETPLQFMESD